LKDIETVYYSKNVALRPMGGIFGGMWPNRCYLHRFWKCFRRGPSW